MGIDYRGLSHEAASHEAARLIKRADETGNWFVIVDKLAQLRDIMQRHRQTAYGYIVTEHDIGHDCPLFHQLQIFLRDRGLGPETANAEARRFMQNFWLGREPIADGPADNP